MTHDPVIPPPPDPNYPTRDVPHVWPKERIVRIPRRIWELPLAIILWLYVVGMVVAAVVLVFGGLSSL